MSTGTGLPGWVHAIDLPAHGDGGEPAPLETVTQPPRSYNSWRPR
jgi:hypothetical protein